MREMRGDTKEWDEDIYLFGVSGVNSAEWNAEQSTPMALLEHRPGRWFSDFGRKRRGIKNFVQCPGSDFQDNTLAILIASLTVLSVFPVISTSAAQPINEKAAESARDTTTSRGQNAQVKYYTISSWLDRSDGDVQYVFGAAAITWNGTEISGKICPYGERGTAGDEQRFALPELTISSELAQNGAKRVLISSPDGTTSPFLNGSSRRYVEAPTQQGDSTELNGIDSPEAPGAKWGVQFDRITNEPLSKWAGDGRSDRYIVYGNQLRRRFDLSKIDAMSPSQALRYLGTKGIPFAGQIVPGKVPFRYDAGRRNEIIKKTEDFKKYIRFAGGEMPSCGAPVMEDVVFVRPGLELFIARKMQAIDGIRSAFPTPLPLSPPFGVFISRDPTLVRAATDMTLGDDEKTEMLRRYMSNLIRQFVEGYRPGHAAKFELRALDSGLTYGYRTRVVGPAVSKCQADGWESFEISVTPISPSPSTVSFALQVVDGRKAPAPLTQRPTDSRLNEHRLDDGELGTVQNAFLAFLRRKQFQSDDTDGKFSPCPL